MNELLSPIMLVCAREAHTTFPTPSADPTLSSTQELLRELLDAKAVEADAYAIFEKMMIAMAPHFIKKEPAKKDRKHISHDLSATAPPSTTRNHAASDDNTHETPIVKKCNYIHHILLSTLDPVLYKHLNSVDVQPTLYVLRWYRLLFGREFHIEDVIVVWDSLWSIAPHPLSENSFNLADFICISMLLYVRPTLMGGDNTVCLRRLLRYPPVEDVRVLITRALHLQNSWKVNLSDPTSNFTPQQLTAVDYIEPINPINQEETQKGWYGDYSSNASPSATESNPQEDESNRKRGASGASAAATFLSDTLSKVGSLVRKHINTPSHSSSSSSTSGNNSSGHNSHFLGQHHSHSKSTGANHGSSAGGKYQSPPPLLPAKKGQVENPLQHQYLAAASHSSSTAHHGSHHSSSHEISSLQAQVAHLHSVMAEMGRMLHAITEGMSDEFEQSKEQGRKLDEDNFLLSISQIKQIRDVLSGQMNKEEIEDHIVALRMAHPEVAFKELPPVSPKHVEHKTTPNVHHQHQQAHPPSTSTAIHHPTPTTHHHQTQLHQNPAKSTSSAIFHPSSSNTTTTTTTTASHSTSSHSHSSASSSTHHSASTSSHPTSHSSASVTASGNPSLFNSTPAPPPRKTSALLTDLLKSEQPQEDKPINELFGWSPPASPRTQQKKDEEKLQRQQAAAAAAAEAEAAAAAAREEAASRSATNNSASSTTPTATAAATSSSQPAASPKTTSHSSSSYQFINQPAPPKPAPKPAHVTQSSLTAVRKSSDPLASLFS